MDLHAKFALGRGLFTAGVLGLLLPAHPELAFVLAVFASDFLDCTPIKVLGLAPPSHCKTFKYQAYDKIIDTLALAYFTFFVLPSSTHWVVQASWVFRAVGVLLFLLTRKEWLLVLFPNFNEILVALTIFHLLGWIPAPVIGLLFMMKIGQEIFLHWR